MRWTETVTVVLLGAVVVACSKASPPAEPPGTSPPTPPTEPPSVAPLADGQLRIVTWNIRFFPEPGTDLARTAAYLVALNADLVAVQEIANRDSLASLLVQVNAALDDLPPSPSRPVRAYEFVLAESGGHGGQHVGFIYDANAIELSGVETLTRLQMTPDLRPALFAAATSLRGGLDFQVIVVHTDSGTDDRDYQNRIRFLDSLRVEVADRRPADADIVVVGDLNTMGRVAGDGLPAIPAEDEISNLDAAATEMGLERIPNAPTCTEYYRGEGSLLDHILAATAMQELPQNPVASVAGYCAEAQCGHLDAANMPYDFAHVSDHCPVVLDIIDQDLD